MSERHLDSRGQPTLAVSESELLSKSIVDPAVQQCPFEYYEALRRAAPVYRAPDGTYMVTSYDLVLELVRMHRVFSSMSPHGGLGAGHCEAAEKLIAEKGYGRFMPVFVNNDPPSHTAYRTFAMRAFRPSRIHEMTDYVAETANALIDTFSEQSECDVVHHFAIPMQLYVIADRLGVPRADFRRFREWSDAWLVGLGLPVPDEAHLRAAEKVVEMQHYLMDQIRQRRKEPGEDLLSDLLQSAVAGERPLTDAEVLSMAENFLVAGNETTTSGIGNGLFRLARDQELQRRVRAAPDLIDRFVEEVLRTDAPVQMMPRYATQDTMLGGVPIPKGAVLMASYGAANRDPSKFVAAEEFDIDRPNNNHVTFGSGIHSCVGSQLARLVMTTSFRSFLRRFDSFHLAVPMEAIRYNASFVLRGPNALPLVLEKAAA